MVDLLEELQLNSGSLDSFVQFFNQRLRDQPSVPVCLRGLILSIDKGISAEMASLIPKAIFEELAVQNYIQTTRHYVFEVFHRLLVMHPRVCEEMGLEFLSGYIQAIDGEKDPRNLLLIFKITQMVISRLNIEDVAEELFEVTSCYFPITFRPPPDDPYGITAEDLKIELRKCMTGSSLFSELGMELIMEKISSSSDGARRDAMDTLSDALSTYSIDLVVDKISDIWKYVSQFFIIDELLFSSLNLIKQLVRALSIADRFLEIQKKFISEVISSCEPEFEMKNGETKLVKSHLLLLSSSLAQGSSMACTMIMNQIMPSILCSEVRDQPVYKKRLFGEFLGDLVNSSIILGMKANDWDEYKEQTFQYLLKLTDPNIATPTLQNVGLKSLAKMAEMPGLISDFDARSLISTLLRLISQAKMQSELQDSCILFIESCKDNYGFLKKFLKEEMDVNRNSIAVLKRLAKNAELHLSVVELFDREITSSNFQSIDALEALTSIFTDFWQNDSCLIASSVLYRLIDLQDMLECDNNCREARSILFGVSFRHLDSEKQSTVLGVIFNGLEIPQIDNCYLIPALANCRKSVVKEHLSSDIVRNLIEASRESPKFSLCYAVAIIANKCSDEITELNEFINDFAKVEISSKNAEMLAWITKALLLKSDKRGYDLLEKFMNGLLCETDGTFIASNFKVIFEDSFLLTKAGYANIKLLYRQRIFSFIVPIIEKKFKSSTNDAADNLLVAFSVILENTPRQLVFSNIKKLIPLFFKSLESGDSSLKKSTLSTLYVTILENSDCVAKHLSWIIPKLLELSKASEESDMDVRISSLKCVGACSSLSFDLIYPHISNVRNLLKICLDDPKRLVRKEATKCRNQWYLVDKVSRS